MQSLIDKNFQIVKNEIEEARLAARERFRWFFDHLNDCCVVDGGMFELRCWTLQKAVRNLFIYHLIIIIN